MMTLKRKNMLIVWVLALYYSATAQVCNKPLLVYTKLAAEHIEPKALNDSLSAEFFQMFFSTLDPTGMFFTQNDLAALFGYRYRLDDEINKASCTFQTEASQRYISKIKRTRYLFDSLLKSPIDFSVKEYCKPPYLDEFDFLENEKKLIQNLRVKLKYEILMTVYRLMQTQGKQDLSSTDFKTLSMLAQQKVKNSMLRKTDNLLKNVTEKPGFIQTQFLKAIARTFDPHSEYFTNEEMIAFSENINAERQSFGIFLKENSMGEVRIGKLVPGGPAWKSGQLHQGDLLVQLSWEGKEPIDLTDLNAQETDELLHQVGDSKGELTVLTSSGEKKNVSLTKEKIVNTENSISSYVLKGKHNFGYIELPGFFTDDGENRLKGCANEVAKEILKLNKQKIDGLILDLRYNGGGSMEEAIELAGIFIDTGPVTIIHDKGEMPASMRDMNKGLAFSGPLVILINSASASASELIAAALQDYNRALIIGGPSFGKATAQVVLPVAENSDNDDFLKITIGRFYRINQNSTQQLGVIPDILLPDISSSFSDRELDLKHSLRPKIINKKTYFTPLPTFPFDSLQPASQKRVASSYKFQTLIKLQGLLGNPFPLHESEFIKTIKAITVCMDSLSPKDQPNPLYEVTLSDSQTAQDLYSKETIVEIKSSMYIQEAFSILADLIHQKK